MLSTARALASPRRLVLASPRGWAAQFGDRAPPGDPQASDPVTDPAVRSDGGAANEKNQTPARYAVSKLASNTAFFVKGARMAVKSVADRVAARAAPRPATTSKPAGDMQDIDDTARAKYDAMLRDEADARQETGHDEPLTSAYPEAGAAARATAGVDQDKKEE